MSTKNPFRTPVVFPNPSGSRSETAIPSQSQINQLPGPPLPRTSSSPPSTSTLYPPSSSPENNNAGPSRSNLNAIERDDLNAEAPPAYTPSADPDQGESTLEVGPRRPFQPSRRPPQQHHNTTPNQNPQGGWLSPQQNGYPYGFSQSSPNIHQQPSGSTSTWSAYPGQQQRVPQQYAPSPLPPPRHPSLSHSRSQSEISSTPATVQSEFARDFYAAGGGDSQVPLLSLKNRRRNQYTPPPVPPPSHHPSLSHSRSQSDMSSIPATAQSVFARDFYAAGGGDVQIPSPSSPNNQYAPPPGAPPGPSGNASTSAVGESRTRVGGIPDNGSPTKIPTPGHPLLLNNKLLVYPGGHECHKCNNTGFKNFDPTHPCRKCWDRYARPYTGPITYTPWSNQSNATSSSRTNINFQRPLPSFRPPHLARSPTGSHNRAISNPTPHSRTSASLSPSPPSQHPHPAIPPPRIHVTSPYSVPPPGSTVVQPGDPRIGGRLCYKCSGGGVVPFMLFEETTCAMCRGIGRLF